MSENAAQYKTEAVQPAAEVQTTQTQSTYNVQMTGKSMIAAYLIWWFLGSVGVHRLYLGKKKSGFLMMALFIVGIVTSPIFIGLLPLGIVGIWWLIDAYYTSVMVTDANAKLGLNNASLSVGTLSHKS